MIYYFNNTFIRVYRVIVYFRSQVLSTIVDSVFKVRLLRSELLKLYRSKANLISKRYSYKKSFLKKKNLLLLRK